MKSINSLLKPFDNKLESPFIMNPSRFASAVADFTDSYDSSTGWTLSANMTISGGQLNYTAVPNTAETSYKSLGVTLSDTLWYADWDYNESADTATDNHAWVPFGLVAGTGNPATASIDSMTAYVVENWSDYRLLIQAKDAGSPDNSGQSTPHLSQSTQYYMRMRRDSATLNFLGAYSNVGRSTLVTSVTNTITSTDANSLTHLHHSSGAGGGGSQTVTAVMDNTEVWDAVAP